MQVTQTGQLWPFVKVHHRNGRVFLRIVEKVLITANMPLEPHEAIRLGEALIEHGKNAAETVAAREKREGLSDA